MGILDFINVQFSKLYKEEYGSLQNDRKLGFYGTIGMIKVAMGKYNIGEINCQGNCLIPEPSSDMSICLSCGKGIEFKHS